jgi:DNA repair protein RecO (recombination protein O)
VVKRIVRTEALCLRSRPIRESSKLITFFALDEGRLVCVARGARRPKSRFGAALEPFAVSRIIYYRHQQKTIYNLSDAELIRAHSGLVLDPARFLAAEQIAELLLRTSRDHDPNERLYGLARTYLAVLDAEPVHSGGETNPGSGYSALVGSFLLKAASFLGFRPRLRACLNCGRPLPGPGTSGVLWSFDPERGGAICPECGTARAALKIEPARLVELALLLHTPATEVVGRELDAGQLGLIRAFVVQHIDLLLTSFNWRVL